MIENGSTPIKSKNDRFSQSTNGSEGRCLGLRGNEPFNEQKKTQGSEKKEVEPKIEYVQDKLNKAMVGWIQMVCWTKDFTMEGTLLAISLMNCYKKSKKIEKSRVEPLLSSCLFLSSKYVGKPVLSLEEIYGVTTGTFEIEEILQMQRQILSIIEYNMHMNNYFLICLENHELSNQQKQRLKFLMEMFLLHDSRILNSEELIKEIMDFSFEMKNKKLQTILAKLIQVKQGKDLIQKYHSQFEVEAYISQLLGSLE